MRASKKLLVYFFSAVLFIQCLYGSMPTMPTQAAAGMPPMSNEEQLLAQQLDSVFEELTKGMSESEKNQFFNELNTAMEEEIDKMSKMNDEELNKYIQDAEKEFQNLGLMPETPATTPQTQPEIIQPEPIRPPAPVVEKEEIKKPSRDMVPTIDEIVSRLDSFIQKANQVVEMAANFEKWGKKGKLHGWNPAMTWAVFKEKLETLKKKLLEVKSLDPKTQRPKYLGDLTADNALCNNLAQFKTVLAKHEPDVQAPSFGLKKLSKSSKNAFIAVINDCLEALIALNLPAEFDKIIAKYEPTAKKLKEAEEKAQQAAVEASKRHPIKPGTMTTTVRKEEPGYYQFGTPGERPGYPSMYGPTQPSYMPEKIGEYKEEKGKEDGKPGEPGKGATQGEKKKEEKAGPTTRKEEVKETETTKAIDRYSHEFIAKLEDARECMNINLSNIENKAKAPDVKTISALTSAITECTFKVNLATKATKNANSLLPRVEKGPQKAKLIQSFKDAWSDVAKDFTRWQNTAQRIAVAPSAPITPKETPEEGSKTPADAKHDLKNAAQNLASEINNLKHEVERLGEARRRASR